MARFFGAVEVRFGAEKSAWSVPAGEHVSTFVDELIERRPNHADEDDDQQSDRERIAILDGTQELAIGTRGAVGTPPRGQQYPVEHGEDASELILDRRP